MRFKAQLANISILDKFTASLASLGRVCWIRLEPDVVRFTVIPDQGTQVWGQLPRETIFDSYTLASAADVINLEVPINALNRALRSATNAVSAQIRLTKKGRTPFLALTIVNSSWTAPKNALGVTSDGRHDEPGLTVGPSMSETQPATDEPSQYGPRERETVVTQEVPVRVLEPAAVEGLHEPRCREPDVHIVLPGLAQLKSISDRFTKLANDTALSDSGKMLASSTAVPKLELSANMHGSMKLGIATDALRISSCWSGLVNPAVDATELSQGTLENLPSERMRQIGATNADSEEAWARVRIDGRDWSRVLSVSRLSPRVVASIVHDTALILYVYLRGTNDACLTYYINSYVT